MSKPYIVCHRMTVLAWRPPLTACPWTGEPYQLKLTGVTPYEDGAVWLRYAVK